MEFPPRYAFPVVGFVGIVSPSQGFCHGATPSSTIWTSRSVTSLRKSRFGLSLEFDALDVVALMRSCPPLPHLLQCSQSHIPRFRTLNLPAAQRRDHPTRYR